MAACIALPVICFQQVDGAGGKAAKVSGAGKYVDLQVPGYLLDYQLAYNKETYENLMAYCAQLHVLGVLAGVLGTPAEQAQYREAVVKAAGTYFSGLLARSQRQHWSDNLSPLDAGATLLGYYYKLWGVGANAVGATDVGRSYHETGDAMISTDPDKLLWNAGADLVNSIASSCKARWDEFWKDWKSHGGAVAIGRLKSDADFLVAELAIDVALAFATGGAALGIKIVGRRLTGAATRVIIRATNTAGKAVPESGILHTIDLPDSKIDKTIIKEVLDEDKFGTGSKSDDVARRAEVPEPAKDKPQGGAAAKPAPKTATQTRTDPVTGKSNTSTTNYDPQTGRPVSQSGSISHDFGSTKRGDNATEIGKLGGQGYQGGHLGGHRFFGDTPDHGIAPQAGNLNQGAWKTMENEWADWTKKGYVVDYKIDVYPPGARVPDSFEASYVVRDPKTGQIVYRNEKEFLNKAGETFKRIPFRDMR
jgi:hypothetical protein